MKNSFKKIVAILGAFLLALPVFAATTATLAPAAVTVASGAKFTVAISVNPQGIANYAEKIELNYPADILEATSFTPDSKWMALPQPGYDSIDNAKGILIKTAGYPGGFSSSALFGTVSFTAKKAGTATMRFGSGSVAFEANSQTSITGNSATVSITAPVIVPKKEVTPAKGAPPVPIKTEKTAEVAPAAEAIPSVNATTSQEAAVTTAVPQGSSNTWGWILGVVAILALGYGAYAVGKKRNR